jgi:putative RecB family exonuclease
MNALLEAPDVPEIASPICEPLRLSATRAKLYLQCPRAYRYQYVDEIPIPITGALAFGSVIHRVLHNLHQWSLAQGEPLNEAVALYEFARLWDEAMEHDHPLFKDDADLVGYSALAPVILLGYIEEHRGKAPPVLLEYPFEIGIEGEGPFPYTLRGVIDRVDEEEDGLVIVDFKTGKRKPSPKLLGEDLQLTIYAWAARELFGQRVKRVVYYHLRDQTPLPVERSDDALAALTDMTLPHVAMGIVQGHFDPHPSFYCRWCPHRELCTQEGGADLRRYEPRSGSDSSPDVTTSCGVRPMKGCDEYGLCHGDYHLDRI